jgi:hypothetical protein
MSELWFFCDIYGSNWSVFVLFIFDVIKHRRLLRRLLELLLRAIRALLDQSQFTVKICTMEWGTSVRLQNQPFESKLDGPRVCSPYPTFCTILFLFINWFCGHRTALITLDLKTIIWI